jgi:uncharacterized protein with beta-barrel porin domain
MFAQFRHAALATSALITASALATLPALADCQPDPAANGQTVTCAGTDSDGFDANGATNLTINVVSGASVSSAAFATISIEALSTVTNNGTIGTGSFAGIFNVLGAGNTVVNAGTIVGANTGIALNFGVVNNTGRITIIGLGNGIFVNNSPVTNSGIIEVSGGSHGAVVGNNFDLTNSGTIVATSTNTRAVEIGGFGGALFNSGTIIAAGTGAIAVMGDVAVTNSGLIRGRVDTFSSVVNLAGGRIEAANGFGAVISTIGPFTNAAGATVVPRATSTPGTFDSIVVGNDATLHGTYTVALQPGLYAATTMHADAVQVSGTRFGAFDTVTGGTAFLAAALVPGTGQNLDLVITRLPFGGAPGETANQRAVGAALDAAYSTAATGTTAVIFSTLLASSTTAVLDPLSGEVATGVQNPSFAMGGAFASAMLGQAQRWRAAAGRGSQGASPDRIQLAAAQPATELAQAAAGGSAWPPRAIGPSLAAWAAGFGLSGNRDGNGGTGSARLGYSMGGGAAGIDVQLKPNLLLGAAIGAAGSGFSLAGTGASGDARTVFFGLYGSWTMDPLYVDAAASYGHGQFSTTRTATLGTTSERVSGEFGGNQYGGSVEAGWWFMVQRYELAPFAGVVVQALHQDGYTETTTNTATNLPGILGLTYQPETTTSVRSFLGGQASTTFDIGERLTVSPRIRLAWAHEFTADRQVSASFLSLPGAAFTVSGARPARDAAIVGAGVDIGIGRSIALYAVRR